MTSGSSKRIAGALALVAAYGVLICAAPGAGLGLTSFALVMGRTEPCERAEALRGLFRHIEWVDGAKRIASSMRLVEKDPAGYDLWDTPRGRYWIPAGSDGVLSLLLSQQQQQIYGPPLAGAVVLDCGAHIGAYTREALLAGARLVVSIEPAPDNVECLRRNFAEEIRAGRVIVYPKGVWNREDKLLLHTVTGNSAGDSFIFKQPGGGVEVPLTTIDHLVKELKLPRITAIKMDIKGAERQALAGAANTLRTQKPRLAVASEHFPDDPERIEALVRSLRPDYTVRCRSCFKSDDSIRPEVLIFEQPRTACGPVGLSWRRASAIL